MDRAILGPPLAVKVCGEWACFTRPEMKVERVSYPVMTPSAARGVLEAIFWKPEFSWRVEEIWVLNPIKYFSILRNEVNHGASIQSARSWAKNGGGYDASGRDNRAQRNTLALRDVKYVIRAQAVPRSGMLGDAAKFRDQFRRRVARGQSFSPPYLGCREFAADFAEMDGSERAAAGSMELGRMLLDLRYAPDGSGRGEPVFFDAKLVEGILTVPPLPEGDA